MQRKLLNSIGFRHLLIATFSVGILLLALISTLVTSSLTGKSVEERLGQEGISLAETFAERSRVALLYRSNIDAKYVADAMLAFPDVLAVSVYDDTKEMLYSFDERPKENKIGNPSSFSWPKTTALDYEDYNHWSFVAPVYTGTQADEDTPFLSAETAPELIGYVRLVLGKNTLHRMQSDIFRYNITVSGLLAAALLLILLGITNRITQPIRRLAAIMQRAQQGERDVRAEVLGTRDVIDMEMAFNAMMDSLENREDELRATRDMALEAARVKGEFAANVSHELRTPLNGVLGMLELLSDMGLNSKQKEYVEIASGSAESLLTLIDDILDFSRIDSGKFDLDSSEFNPRELLEDIVLLMGQQAQRKEIDLAALVDPAVPIQLSGDCARLRQVLINLIGNALKFTERGEVGIEVSLRGVTEGSAKVCFSVFDTGIGMDSSVLDKIFEAFSQADGSTTRKYGGTGLGLAISKQLVEVMDGELGVESTLGEGSRFWFVLPFTFNQINRLPEKKAISGDALRVMVADDSQLNRRYLGQQLAELGLRYELVTNGLEALEKLRAAAQKGNPFDILLVDEIMPGIKGPDLGHLIKSDSTIAQTQIIMMANKPALGGVETQQLDLGGILSKPVYRKELVSLLKDIQVHSAKEIIDSPPAVKPEEIEPFQGSRVLVVEDNRANQQVAIGMLERLGCRWLVADNGLEALKIIGREPIDLVLMDCHMPEMDGYETTAQIRRLSRSENELPIVAMTANVQKGESEKCLAVGMNAYLPKPLKLEDLRVTIGQWLPASSNSLNENNPLGNAILESAIIADEIIDRDVCGELAEQIGDAFNTMLKVFLDDLPTYLRSLKDAVAVGDATAYADIAHSIKGTASNFGARNLVGLCQEVETSGRAGHSDQVGALIARLVIESEKLQHVLQQEYVHEQLNQGVTAEALEDNPADEEILETVVNQPDMQRILIVDDDRGMRFAMRKVLEKDGYRVDEVCNGEQALMYCERFMPDLVLMDAIMPEMDGFKACAEIQTLPLGKGVPVLIITALNDEISIGRAFASGAIDYISKPVNFAVLRRRIARILQASQAEKYVHQLAYNDTLTGLPNRTLFTDSLNEIIAEGKADSMTAILFLDLDRFKLVNDTFGHDAGDLLLKVVAERLLGCVRQGDIVSRFGGDEFTILLKDVRNYDVVKSVASKIQQTLSRPFVFLGKEMHVSTSIGIAMHPQDGNEISTLLKNADIAMYRAKSQGDCFEFYEKEMELDVARRLGIENDLHGAIMRGEMRVFYQPQQDLETGELIGAEALVRWQHPKRGLVAPQDFIPLAEETGQILQLGEWVMEHACTQLKSWLDEGKPAIRMAVNLAGRQLDGGEMVDCTSRILRKTGLNPELLELEITESTIMENAERVIGTLNELKEMGVKLAVDDFGTGYSSLNYLKRFPIDMLKIDRAFVSDITNDKVDADIVTTIIALAHSLGVKVIAEGVETELQKQFLKQKGCDYIQGFFLGKPQPADEFALNFLSNKSSAA